MLDFDGTILDTEEAVVYRAWAELWGGTWSPALPAPVAVQNRFQRRVRSLGGAERRAGVPARSGLERVSCAFAETSCRPPAPGPAGDSWRGSFKHPS